MRNNILGHSGRSATNSASLILTVNLGAQHSHIWGILIKNWIMKGEHAWSRAWAEGHSHTNVKRQMILRGVYVGHKVILPFSPGVRIHLAPCGHFFALEEITRGSCTVSASRHLSGQAGQTPVGMFMKAINFISFNNKNKPNKLYSVCVFSLYVRLLSRCNGHQHILLHPWHWRHSLSCHL